MYIQTISNSYQPKTDVFNTFKNEPKIRNGYRTRTYRNHNYEKAENKVKLSAAIGGILGALIPAMIFAKKQNTNIFKLEYGIKEMLTVSSGGILGGTVAGIIENKKQHTKHKVKEGVFQFLNATVPLATIPLINNFVENSPKLNNIPCKIAGTAAGLLGGMVIAADLSNRIIDPKDKEPDRKLNYKDAMANIDDALGALVLAKLPLVNHLPIETALPAIYAWCGYRAGQNN